MHAGRILRLELGVTRFRRLGFVAAALVVTASLVTPTVAWAKYRGAGAETNTFATHVLLAPGRPTCAVLGILSIRLTWTAPSDSSFVDGYQLGVATSSGGTYSYTNVGLVLTTTVGIGLGDFWYVVRSMDSLWRGAVSLERKVNGLGIVATCL